MNFSLNLSKEFTRREKGLLVILAVLCLIAVYMFAVHYPVKNNLETIAVQQENAEMELQILTLKQQRMEQMNTELEQITQGEVVLTPDYDNLQQLMAFLNGVMASTTDYTINMQAVQIPEEGNIIRRPAEMTFVCSSYSEARAVVEKLHACPYRYLIDDLRMTPANRDQQTSTLKSGNVQVTLSITFFETMK